MEKRKGYNSALEQACHDVGEIAWKAAEQKLSKELKYTIDDFKDDPVFQKELAELQEWMAAEDLARMHHDLLVFGEVRPLKKRDLHPSKDIQNLPEIIKKLRGEPSMSEEVKPNNRYINMHNGMGFKVNNNPNAVYESAIPSGAYTLEWPQMLGDTFSVIKKETVSDKIITSDTDVTADVLSYLKKFLSPETKETFKKFGMNYSTGVLKYGRPGTGKTVGINKFVKQFLAEHNGYVLYASNPKDVRPFAQHFRQDKNIPIVIVMEELELLIERGHEHSFLELLDGQEKIENIIYLATTNHLDRIPDRIKNRPSRFARVLEVKEPDHKTRHQYVLGMTGDETTANMIAEVTEGLVMDEIKHVVINVACFEADPKAAAAHFKHLAGEKTGKSKDDNGDFREAFVQYVDQYLENASQVQSGTLIKAYSSN